LRAPTNAQGIMDEPLPSGSGTVSSTHGGRVSTVFSLPLGEGARGRGMKRNANRTLFVRNLRRNQTEAEKVLWARLRSRQMTGAKFRRQQPIGRYIADFVSLETKLIVEIDGGQHDDSEGRANDERRTAWLNEKGFRVLRFWNNEVLTNTNGVLEKISEALE